MSGSHVRTQRTALRRSFGPVQLFIAVAFGAMLTIAAAWLVEGFHNSPRNPLATTTQWIPTGWNPGYEVDITHGIDFARHTVHVEQIASLEWRVQSAREKPHVSYPWWCPTPTTLASKLGKATFVEVDITTVHASGIPVPAMYWLTNYGGTNHLGSVGAIRVPIGSRSRVPIFVSWAPFLADTVVWATIVWCTVMLPLSLFRSRYSPHKCTQCGYYLRGLLPEAPCPECGGSRNPNPPHPVL